MTKVPQNTRDSKGLFVRDGVRRIYITNPDAWRAVEGGDIVIAKIPSWGPYWTATWRKNTDTGQAGNAMVDWLKHNTVAAPKPGAPQEEAVSSGKLFKAILVASVREKVEDGGHLTGAATDAYVFAYNSCEADKSDKDDKGAYVQDASTKVYLVRPADPSEALYVYTFGNLRRVRVAAPGESSSAARELAGDWLREHSPSHAPDPDILYKDRGKLRAAMRRLNIGGRFDDLTGEEQDKVVSLVSRDYIEIDGAYVQKRGFREQKLKTGTLLRKLQALSAQLDGTGAGDDDREALAEIYGRLRSSRSGQKRTQVARAKKRVSSRRARPKKTKPKRKLMGVAKR